MKGMIAVVICAAVFVAGALYGIDKNNEKAQQEPKVVTTEIVQASDPLCLPPEKKEHVPWIVHVATGIGEGIAMTFNGVIVVMAEIIQSGSS